MRSLRFSWRWLTAAVLMLPLVAGCPTTPTSSKDKKTPEENKKDTPKKEKDSIKSPTGEPG
jgi:hypothetical protein